MNFQNNSSLVIFFVFFYAVTASAQQPVYFASNNNSFTLNENDSFVLNSKAAEQGITNFSIDLSNPQQRRRLITFLKKISNTDIHDDSVKTKGLYHLATIFTKLRLYPLAMKCFFKTVQRGIDSISTGNIPITANDDSLLEKHETLFGVDTDKVIRSTPISIDAITETFNDGKTAIAYAMILHVKQPVRGKRKIIKLVNTGHSFITLIKYNSDSTYATISFGFYPVKDHLLSATPILPSTSATFEDDSRHNWDEVLGKFISKQRFNKILRLTQQYRNVAYHLSKNNCTDFGLKAAAIAGLQVFDTKGSWPLGSGNSPAITGESLLQGKFKNTDTNDNRFLLITNRN